MEAHKQKATEALNQLGEEYEAQLATLRQEKAELEASLATQARELSELQLTGSQVSAEDAARYE